MFVLRKMNTYGRGKMRAAGGVKWVGENDIEWHRLSVHAKSNWINRSVNKYAGRTESDPCKTSLI